jgi:excisionase family DNA binding protein
MNKKRKPVILPDIGDYNTHQLALKLGVSVPTIIRECKAGRLEYYFVGNCRRFKRETVEKMRGGKVA